MGSMSVFLRKMKENTSLYAWTTAMFAFLHVDAVDRYFLGSYGVTRDAYKISMFSC